MTNEKNDYKDENDLESPMDYSIKHPLQNCWTLWYYESDRSQPWELNQREIASFQTVEDFWSLYNHIKPASELKQGTDYSLFKKGIRPMWEDPANKRGGRWLISLDKKQRLNDLDRYWLDIILCLIGEAFEHSDEICGAVVNLRYKGDKIDSEEIILKKFPYEDQQFIERYLGGTNFDINAAFERIKANYQLILQYPEWFTKDQPISKKELIDKDIRIGIPETDKEGRPIYIVKIGNVDPSSMDLMDIIAVDDIWLESILMKNASETGLCVVMDIDNLPFRALKWLTPHNVKTGLKKLQCLPFKDYRFHIVNDSIMFKAAINLIWPFVPENIKKMVKFHFNDRRSLHKFIDPVALPLEYGGTNEKIDYAEIREQLYAQNEQIFENFQTYRSVQLTS
ncbi:retinaldehyde-binding protein 1-like isoform X2 [Anthonomus grandis grandis]|uniref:retinaldehyde-binding protein 1-like isoform X2 n=1 Tax=Anthonomus grandis grandis TaxID=2921223 RepID=UPI002166AC5B|nr:retinaldehyde-binding protein 1-like isoform X2 [Anthonomus grandis grandis]